MADTIRGNGLLQVDNALAALVDDPERLDHAIARFGRPPPPCASDQSHNTTRTQSPDAPNGEQRRREERQWQLRINRGASLPDEQLSAQVQEEQERIIEADANGTRPVPVGTDFYELAKASVRTSWVEQGIWNDNWNDMAQGRWKHEEPLELSSESEAETKEASKRYLFSSMRKPKSITKRLKSDEEIRRAAKRRARRKRDREASRPFHQFVYQLSKERERIQDELSVGQTAHSVPADINTKAYENVKNVWIKRGIWDTTWGTLPGMSWKHERPLEEVPGNDSVPAQAGTPDNSRGAERVTLVFEPQTSARSNQQASGATGLNPLGLVNGIQHSPPPSNPSSSTERRGVRTATRQRREPAKRPIPSNTEQARQLAEKSLGPVSPLKVSKPRRTNRPGPAQNGSAKARSANAPLLLSAESHEPRTKAAGISQRKSLRLQSGTGYIDGIVPADLPKNPPRTRDRRAGAGALRSEGSAKPQGVSKRYKPR